MVKNHGFADGNKRTALYLLELLVRRSGYTLLERDEVLVEIVTEIANGTIGYDFLVEWFRDRLVPTEGRGQLG